MRGPILVVAPHALDEVLGCGGTIAAHAAAGDPVYCFILCGDGTGIDSKRREAAHAAAALLGSEPPQFGGFPENRSDTVALGTIVSLIEDVVRRVKPRTVYVSHGGNLNVDHQTASRATATALRPVPGGAVSRFFSYEIASSTDWAPPGFGAPFLPTHFVDISRTLDKKLQALKSYEFDMRPAPHARSMISIERLAGVRGNSVGVLAAEAFMVLRSITTIR
ncbi:MAG TPA: PIG-L deacetylase family protein [Pseudolabrys sp.]|nr:PIG-L deacetylase family protein [Pseudolabrys sp.]